MSHELCTLPSVLLLEDDSSIAAPLLQVLAYSGFRAIHASDGITALRYLDADPVTDIVLVDLVLPGMSGKKFVEIVRSRDHLQHVPVILITGAAPDLGEFPPAATYQECISKPFSVTSLLAAINRLVTS